MKKAVQIMKTVLIICILLCLSACGAEKEQEPGTEQEEIKVKDTPKQAVEEDKILITYTAGVEDLAQILKRKTGGDEFIIREEAAYPQELDEYDIIYLGYEVSEHSIPGIIRSFLEGYDFTGKTLIPFGIHDGDGAGTSVYDIGNLCPDTKVTTGFEISRSRLPDAEDEITFWLQTLDMR